jgi:hypothetical protein
VSRRLARLFPAAVLVWCLAAGFGGVSFADATTPRPPTTAALRICSGCDGYGLADGSRYSYVILHAWQAGLIPQLKAANPGLKAFVYKDMAATVSYACKDGRDDALLPAGVGYCWAGANRPEWFLKDTNGQRIEFCDFAGAWQMDVGDAAYQQQWATSVLADLKAGGWDGVMIDDANQSERWHLCGRTIAKYPTDADYSAATDRFLASVGPALKSQGFVVLPNISIDEWWSPSGLAVWDRWVSYSSGAILEYFSKWGHSTGRWFTDDGVHNDWSSRQQLLVRTQSAGKLFLGITYAPSDDVRSMRYARASYLVDWAGGPGALVFQPTTPEQQDPYFAAWTADVGVPSGPRTKVGVAWLRRFSGGVVLVNPSPATAQHVELGGSYLLADGTAVTSLTIAPTDGLVLRAAAASAPPVNTALPTVSSTRRGTVLVASTGTWSGAPTSFAYQWLRCDASGAGCTRVLTATQPSYQIASGDVSYSFRVAVTASNAGGSATATSAAASPRARRTSSAKRS